ncbi:hypothetical protein PQN06_004674 [Klebsiella pneumoniae]|nr:hypothetical protein [Klebsiella pneumoniae]
MSLSGNFTVSTENGSVVYPYATITAFRGNSEKIAVDVFVGNKTAGGDGVFRTYEFAPDLTAEINFIEQGYNYLQTLPEFSGAEDL